MGGGGAAAAALRPPGAAAEARRRLAAILGPGAEQRPGQGDYASAAAAAFAPRDTRGDPAIVLAEAGTGTGKTLGYVAPASLWAERNGAPVWISTYTRHLQRQVEGELGRLLPGPGAAPPPGRGAQGAGELPLPAQPGGPREQPRPGRRLAGVIPLGLIARWALATADGDIAGGDLPGWFAELFGPRRCWALPTGGASASTAPARITGAASWSTRSAGPGPPTWWWPTMRWS